MRKCTKCGKKLRNRKNMYCNFHAHKHLEELRELGYLEPLKYQTQDGEVVLSRRKFLTLDRTMEISEQKSSD